MKDFVSPLHRFLLNLNPFLFIALFSLLGFSKSLFFSSLSTYFNLEIGGLEFESFFEEFLIIVFLGPLAETLIFQMMIFYFASFLIPKKSNIIFISAFIFGLTHYYSLLYVLSATVGGVLLAYAYYVFDLKKSYPFWATFTIHSLYNMYLLLYSHFLDGFE